jgi:predicted nucleotidyltransferase
MNKDHYYNVSKLAILRPFLSNPIFALGVHWVFQGMLYMDWTERVFRIGVEVALASVFLFLLVPVGRFPIGWAVTIAFLIAHTLNFLFNGQMWVVLKHFNLVKHSRAEFDEYLGQLAEKIRTEPSIGRAAVYGSIVRGEWNPASDLDVRLVRRTGVANGLRACWFVLRERTRALLNKFPLDIYVLDGPERLVEMRADELPREVK